MNKLISASQYCASVFDGTHDTPEPVINGYPLVTSKNILGGTLDLKQTYNISEDDYLAIQKRSAVSQWDIVFSMIGSIGETYLEKNKDIPYAIKNVGVFSCQDEYKAKWLYYYLISPYSKKFIDNYLAGAVQKFLPLGTLRNFPVLPFDESKKGIIEILARIDEKIELNNKIKRDLESMAKLIYDYWFVQFDFPDKNGNPYKTSGGSMVRNDELKREIPGGWEVRPLGQLLEIQRGISYTSGEILDTKGDPLLSLNSFNLDGTYKFDGIKYFSGKSAANQSIHPGDLLVAATDVTRNAEIIGKSFIVPDIFSGKNIYFSMDLVRVTSLTGMSTHFLHMLFNSSYYHNYIKYFATGTLVLHLNMDGINWYKIPVPSNHLLEQYDCLMTDIEKKLGVLLLENQKLAGLRDWLLPMLMNGQVTLGE